MDDWVAIVETKEEANNVLNKMKDLLWSELRLKTNAKTQIFPIKNGVDFLGFHTYITQTGKVIRRIRRDSKERAKKRVKGFKKLYDEGEINKDTIIQSYSCWKGHAAHGDTKGLFRVTDQLYAEIFEGDES